MEIVGIFVHKGTSKSWLHAPATSEFFNQKNWIPNLGDRIALRSSDYESLNIELNDTVVTVKEKIYNYSLCEVAIVCEYEPF